MKLYIFTDELPKNCKNCRYHGIRPAVIHHNGITTNGVSHYCEITKETFNNDNIEEKRQENCPLHMVPNIFQEDK